MLAPSSDEETIACELVWKRIINAIVETIAAAATALLSADIENFIVLIHLSRDLLAAV
jgi:hypothetical protein